MITKLMLHACYCALKKRLDNATMVQLYEYETHWAEESSVLNRNTDEFSYGNGGTGINGLPVGNGWEITEYLWHADNMGPANSFEIIVRDTQDTGSIVDLFNFTASANGAGQVNNGHERVVLTSPVAVPNGAVINFRTGAVTGNTSDVRVGVRLRRPTLKVVGSIA